MVDTILFLTFIYFNKKILKALNDNLKNFQGFASGDLDFDAFAVRLFASLGIEFLCTQSFAKNFGLYNERVGNLVLVTNNKQQIPEIKSQLTLIVRGMYSNPPNHGARIVSTVLNNPELYEQWYLFKNNLTENLFSKIF